MRRETRDGRWVAGLNFDMGAHWRLWATAGLGELCVTCPAAGRRSPAAGHRPPRLRNVPPRARSESLENLSGHGSIHTPLHIHTSITNTSCPTRHGRHVPPCPHDAPPGRIGTCKGAPLLPHMQAPPPPPRPRLLPPPPIQRHQHHHGQLPHRKRCLWRGPSAGRPLLGRPDRALAGELQDQPAPGSHAPAHCARLWHPQGRGRHGQHEVRPG